MNRDTLRQIAFASLPMIFFGIISVNLLISGNDEFFSRLGSAIIAWAVFNLTLRRDAFASALFEVERNRLVAHNNRQISQFDLMQESLNRTFDLHAAHSAQVAMKLGMPNPFVESDPIKVREFCERVDRNLNDPDWEERAQEVISRNGEIEKEYAREKSRLGGWTRLIFKAEAVLIIWGTLQWGYGDLLVKSFHANAG
jgi:hypothetical protein